MLERKKYKIPPLSERMEATLNDRMFGLAIKEVAEKQLKRGIIDERYPGITEVIVDGIAKKLNVQKLTEEFRRKNINPFLMNNTISNMLQTSAGIALFEELKERGAVMNAP
ncbi:MAG: hypothetical protein QXO69_00245 [archaeon]